MFKLSLDFGNANGISKEENLNVHIPVQSTDFRRQLEFSSGYCSM